VHPAAHAAKLRPRHPREGSDGHRYEDKNVRIVLAIVVVVAGITLAVTTGDSYAVRWVTLLLSLDVAARLALPRRAG